MRVVEHRCSSHSTTSRWTLDRCERHSNRSRYRKI